MPDEIDATASPGGLSRTQLWFFCVLLLAYALLSHYSSSDSAPRGLAVALSFGPVFLISVVLIWRWGGRALAVITAVCAGAAMFRYWGFLEQHYEAADLIEQCGAYGLIALSFAQSLFHVPLCTRLAQEMHGILNPLEITYTRFATVAWAIYYLLILVAIVIVYFVESQRIWSLFVNFATFGLIAVACGTDYFLRLWLLPRRPGGGILTMLRRALVG